MQRKLELICYWPTDERFPTPEKGPYIFWRGTWHRLWYFVLSTCWKTGIYCTQLTPRYLATGHSCSLSITCFLYLLIKQVTTNLHFTLFVENTKWKMAILFKPTGLRGIRICSDVTHPLLFWVFDQQFVAKCVGETRCSLSIWFYCPERERTCN